MLKFGSHPFPDLDSIVATWLFKKKVIENEDFKFEVVGSDKPTDRDIVLIDIGLGKYDHHQYIGICDNCSGYIAPSFKNQTCPHCNQVRLTNANITQISASYIVANKHDLISPSIGALVSRVNSVDSVLCNDFKPYDLFFAINGLNEIYKNDYHVEIYTTLWDVLDEMYIQGCFRRNNFCIDDSIMTACGHYDILSGAFSESNKQEKYKEELVERARKFIAVLKTENNEEVEVFAFASDTDMNIGYNAYSRDFILYVFKDALSGIAGFTCKNPGKGDVGIPEIDLTELYNRVNSMEKNKDAEWYLHWSKRLLLCGSKKRNFSKEKVTSLSFQQLIDMVKK